MNFKEFLTDNILLMDGGMGTLLQSQGLLPGELPEGFGARCPQVIEKVHKAYLEAGAEVVYANTFGANSLKFDDKELEEVIAAAISSAKNAVKSVGRGYVALDIGPTGRLLSPLGDLDFEKAVEIFAKTVRLGVKYGVDLVAIETMNDSYETKAALLAVKENSTLPVIVTNAYGEDGKLMTGASPEAMVAMLEGMGVDAVGANCSLGPRALASVAKRLVDAASVPVIIKPNAGLPALKDGKTVYDLTPEEFALQVAELVDLGVRGVGGCCGTTPEYISALGKLISNKTPCQITDKGLTVVSSYTHEVTFGSSPVLIGERINPTGKKRIKAALTDGEIDYILGEGVAQAEKGAQILDVNVGIPGIDEEKMLTLCVKELQTVTDLPLQIDTADPVAMESALRRYNGKAMINSVNGKAESMAAVFPLVKKYGGVVVALTLDEGGIPQTVEGRVKIAEKILSVAKEYGIDKKDIIFDTLAMTVSADSGAAGVTLGALEYIRHDLGCNTSLGVSNVSFGLPMRDYVNGTFFAMALTKGLSAAIMNPYSQEMMRVYYAYRALSGIDEGCLEYVEKAPTLVGEITEKPIAPSEGVKDSASGLGSAIIKGFKDRAAEISAKMLDQKDPLEIVNTEIIPALNTVGEGFEKGKIYLPSLLMSAEAAKAAFEVIKSKKTTSTAVTKATVVIATVEGDIHDIGKNIVKLLLENYGYKVVDLGKDVPAEEILSATLENKAPLVGLSALMTTTVPAMEKTIKLLRKEAPFTKIMVGGAVLTAEYARKIGADAYAKDAMEGVRLAEELTEK